MTESQVREQLKYYGIPAGDLDGATAYAMELIDDRGTIDLAEFAEAYAALPEVTS